MDFEKLGLFYLGRRVDADTHAASDVPLLYDASDLVTHAAILGMTGSGKTGLGIGLIEEAAIDGIPVIAIDPKGDLSNLLLTFPDLRPEDFQPWVNVDEARTVGLTAEAFAAQEAERWRQGLAEWGQGPDRIARLRAAAEFAVYTPGSRAAKPLSVLRSFDPPPANVLADPELLAERATAAASSVLALAGADAGDPRSREYILVSTILTEAWRKGRALDLPSLIAEVQTPPVQRVGVLDLESFYPAAERFKLATDLNRLLAAPDFAVWLEGEPLDIASLLYTPAGKPRVAVLSISHLDDRERMFFVSLLLDHVVAWMRAERGTSTLRALIYMDEVAGYLPPVAMPASKRPLLTLLKQARAFGVGLTLATQNPVDLDYKALSNAGTWFLGRLQTDRDKTRLLDGLESARAAAGEGFDRAAIDKLLSSLEKRTFLLHNVHEDQPVLFKTRWTLSYLRGPLGREELRRLSAGVADVTAAAGGNGAADEGAAATTDSRAAASAAPTPVEPGAAATPVSPPPVAPSAVATPARAPVLNAAIPVYYQPGDASAYVPMLLGAARVYYADARRGVDETRDVVVWTPILEGPVTVDWEHAEPAPISVDELAAAPAAGATFPALPSAASDPKSYTRWTKDFAQWTARSPCLELLECAPAKLLSRPDESERAFRIRLQTTLNERRDAEMQKLRARYTSKLATLDARVRRAEAAIARERQQAAESKMQVGVSLAATVFGALLGRKAVSTSTLGRATTAARGLGRAGREAADIERAEQEAAALAAERDALAATLDKEMQAIAERWDAATAPLERVLVKPKRGGVSVHLVALVWARG